MFASPQAPVPGPPLSLILMATAIAIFFKIINKKN